MKILQEYIKSEYHKLEGTGTVNIQSVVIPDTINNVPWRPPGIKHKKNEIFLDVVEKLNMLVSFLLCINRIKIRLLPVEML